MAKLLRYAVLSYLTLTVGVANAQNLFGTIEMPDQLPEPPLPIVQVQVQDQSLKIGQLEEQVRQLTGRLEELGFQMLQMQEQMRQMQQDNEFRFQDLEKSSNSDQSNLAPKTPRINSEDTTITLGTPEFDANGNLVEGVTVGAVGNVAAGELYKQGYSQILAGDYADAASSFQTYINQYPDENQVSDAYFWLGEAYYSQGAFKDAARTFLDAHKAYPNANKAPDTLLKLGMSLVALDNRETACATYTEVGVRYPAASKAIKDKVASEQSRAQC
ncbi:MAG: tol-pal system protein YbgF [Lentilitoribacter sp.]